jgi:hypothetical protein
VPSSYVGGVGQEGGWLRGRGIWWAATAASGWSVSVALIYFWIGLVRREDSCWKGAAAKPDIYSFDAAIAIGENDCLRY